MHLVRQWQSAHGLHRASLVAIQHARVGGVAAGVTRGRGYQSAAAVQSADATERLTAYRTLRGSNFKIGPGRGKTGEGVVDNNPYPGQEPDQNFHRRTR